MELIDVLKIEIATIFKRNGFYQHQYDNYIYSNEIYRMYVSFLDDRIELNSARIGYSNYIIREYYYADPEFLSKISKFVRKHKRYR